MTPPHRRESITRQDFSQGLRLLDRSTSWFMWNSVLMVLLPPATIVLLSLPFRPLGIDVLARALLVVMTVINILTLRQQRLLKLFRNHLIEQIDIATKERVRAEQLQGLAIVDPLTGLYNRRFGETRLQEEIARAEESGNPLIVLAIDFDKFKEINDQYGHAAGDLALRTFSRRLQRAIRACDVPIRVGGDEFLVILPECPPNNVQSILSRMSSIEVALNGQQIPVCFSTGMAQYEVNDTPKTIVGRADERLYDEKAKRPGIADAERRSKAEQEARQSPRYPFVAAVELLDMRSESSFKNRTSDLSLTGCYLDMLNPLPLDNPVTVKIGGLNGSAQHLLLSE